MIVVGVDGSSAARAALAWAADDARLMRERLHVVHAIARWPYQVDTFPGPQTGEVLIREAERVVAEATAFVRERWPEIEVTTDTLEGSPALILRDVAAKASEIVVGSRGRGGFGGALLGSVSIHVAGHARCPVVVVRAECERSHGEIVVGVDDSPACEPALDYAFRQAGLREVRLRAVHAWQLPLHDYPIALLSNANAVTEVMRKGIGDRLAPYHRAHPAVAVVEDVRYAHPVQALIRASETADLVVVGSHGRGGVRSALLGSVSHGILHHARSAVAVVRS